MQAKMIYKDDILITGVPTTTQPLKLDCSIAINHKCIPLYPDTLKRQAGNVKFVFCILIIYIYHKNIL